MDTGQRAVSESQGEACTRSVRYLDMYRLCYTTEVQGCNERLWLEAWSIEVEVPVLKQRYESTMEVLDTGKLYEVWDTGQMYDSTMKVLDAGQFYEVWHTGQMYESTMEVLDTGQLNESIMEVLEAGKLYEVWDIRQMYESTREVQDVVQQQYEVLDTGQQYKSTESNDDSPHNTRLEETLISPALTCKGGWGRGLVGWAPPPPPDP